jgi:hypothetical protein
LEWRKTDENQQERKIGGKKKTDPGRFAQQAGGVKVMC